jgi:Mor family transcriptional regulator
LNTKYKKLPEAVQTLFRRLCSDFGHSSGKAIIRVIVEELGGMRITVPGFKDIYREERNRKIYNLFNGALTAQTTKSLPSCLTLQRDG